MLQACTARDLLVALPIGALGVDIADTVCHNTPRGGGEGGLRSREGGGGSSQERRGLSGEGGARGTVASTVLLASFFFPYSAFALLRPAEGVGKAA